LAGFADGRTVERLLLGLLPTFAGGADWVGLFGAGAVGRFFFVGLGEAGRFFEASGRRDAVLG